MMWCYGMIFIVLFLWFEKYSFIIDFILMIWFGVEFRKNVLSMCEFWLCDILWYVLSLKNSVNFVDCVNKNVWEWDWECLVIILLVCK